MSLATIDTRISTYLPTLINRQTSYIGSKGRYLQALQVHDSIPTIDIAQPPRSDVRPSDVEENLPDLCPYPSDLDFTFRIDVYETEEGKGCRLVIYVIVEGSIWEKIIPIIGPDLFNHDWHLFELGLRE